MTFYLEIAKVNGLPNVNLLRVRRSLFTYREAKQGYCKPKQLTLRPLLAKKPFLKLGYTVIPSNSLITVYLLEKYCSVEIDSLKRTRRILVYNGSYQLSVILNGFS